MPTPNLFGRTASDTKVFRLSWVGGSINAEPAGWNEPGFDDSGWETPVAPIPDPNGGWPATIDPGQKIVPEAAHNATTLDGLNWLGRIVFDLATVGTEMVIYVATDNQCDVSVNGVEIDGTTGAETIVLGVSELVVGENVIGLRVGNQSTNNLWSHNPTYVEARVFGDGTLAGPAPPEPVDPGIIVEVNAVELDNLVEKHMRVELNGPGSFQIAIGRHDEQATEANFTRGNIFHMTFTEIDPDPIGEFILESGKFILLSSHEKGGEILDFGGPGSLAYLKNALLDFETHLPLDDDRRNTGIYPDEDVWRFDTALIVDDISVGQILYRVLDEANSQTPDPIPGLTITFSIGEDTDNVDWPIFDGVYTVAIGTRVLPVALELTRLGQCDIRMDPGLIFNAYVALGRDLTGTSFAAGVVRFEKGINIASELTRGMAGREWHSHLLIKRESGYIWVEHPDPPSAEIRTGFLDLTNLDGDEDVEKAAIRKMIYGDQLLEQLTFEIPCPPRGTPVDDDNGIYLPGQDWTENGRFWVGDYVTLHTGTGALDYDNATFRVAAISIYGDPEDGNQIRCIVELNSVFTPEDGTLPVIPHMTGETKPGGGGETEEAVKVHQHSHGSLKSITANQHHTEDHAARHAPGGDDELPADVVGIPVVLGDGVDVIAADTKVWFEVPFACVIIGWSLRADASGSIVLDLWKDTQGSAPAGAGDSITASDKPTLSSAIEAQDLAPTGWTTAVTAGDWITVNVDSATTVKQVTLSLRVRRT